MVMKKYNQAPNLKKNVSILKVLHIWTATGRDRRILWQTGSNAGVSADRQQGQSATLGVNCTEGKKKKKKQVA